MAGCYIFIDATINSIEQLASHSLVSCGRTYEVNNFIDLSCYCLAEGPNNRNSCKLVTYKAGLLKWCGLLRFKCGVLLLMRTWLLH